MSVEAYVLVEVRLVKPFPRTATAGFSSDLGALERARIVPILFDDCQLQIVFRFNTLTICGTQVILMRDC